MNVRFRKMSCKESGCPKVLGEHYCRLCGKRFGGEEE